jgi:hypothetical protein
LEDTNQAASPYLESFQKNVRRRIRPSYREYRDTLLLDALPLMVDTIAVGKEPPREVRNVRLHFLLALQKIGVGSLMLFFEDYDPVSPDDWLGIRDPRLVSVRLRSPIYNRVDWPLMTLVRFIVLLAYMGLLQRADLDPADYVYLEAIESDDKLEAFLREELSERQGDVLPELLVEVDNYPFLYVEYDLPTAELRRAVEAQPADIRLFLCGDRNWSCKSDEVVERSVLSSDTSSRDSIFWFVNSEGVVKLASNQLETPFEESVTAMWLESDIVLTMRYFLQSISRLLLKATKERMAPIQLNALREELFANLDKYCNLEVSHKDTTRWRIEKYKEIFRVDTLYERVVERFELLGEKMGAIHASIVQGQQSILTLVFGFFGSLNALLFLAYEFPMPSGKNAPWWSVWWAPGAVSLVVASVITLGLWLALKTLRERY